MVDIFTTLKQAKKLTQSGCCNCIDYISALFCLVEFLRCLTQILRQQKFLLNCVAVIRFNNMTVDYADKSDRHFLIRTVQNLIGSSTTYFALKSKCITLWNELKIDPT